MEQGRGTADLSREATVSLFRPARNTILLFLGFVTSMAVWFGVTAGPALGLGFALKLAAMLVAAAIISFSQFRDGLFALSVVLSALPGAALVFAGAALMETRLPPGLLPALVFALGFAVALLAAERFVLRVTENEDPVRSGIALLRADGVFPLPILIVSAATPVAAVLAIPGHAYLDALLLAGANAAAVFSAWVAVPLLGSFLRADEDFIARTNRIREGWSRRLDSITPAARPPWAWSASGILLVFLVLAFFGSTNIAGGARSALIPVVGSTAAVVFIGAFLAARDARRTVAAFVATGAAPCLAAWGFARAGATFDGMLSGVAIELLAIAFVPVAATAAAAARSRREEAVSASEAGVQAAGPSAAAGMLAAFLLLAPWYREGGGAGLGAVLALVFAACGAFVFQPAIMGVLETLVPRRKTLAERYRVK